MEEILASIRRIISDDDQEQSAAADQEQAPDEADEAAQAPEAAAQDPPAEAAEADAPAPDADSTAEDIQAAIDSMMADQPEAEEEEVLELTEPVVDDPAEIAADPAELADDSAETAADPAELADDPVEAETGMEQASAVGDEVVFLDKSEDELDAEFGAAPAPKPEPHREFSPGMAEPAAQRPAQTDERLLSAHSDASVASAFSSLENFVLSTHSRTLEDLVSEMLRPLLRDWLDANLPPLVERLVREEIERVSRGRR